MILRAKTVLPMTAPPLDNGAVAMEGDHIVAVGPVDEVRAAHAGQVRDLGEVVLLPGLINAHCHLDYTRLRGEVAWHGVFIQWALELVALKKVKTEADWLSGIQWGIDQLLRTGTTTVVNIASFPSLIDQTDARGLRIIWCLELIDLNRDQTDEEIVKQAEEFIDARPALLGRYGFSPHAPYTASGGLYSLAAKAAHARGVSLTTHVAESEEEDNMFRRGTGPMYDYFRRAGREMSDCRRVGVVQLLHEWGVLGPSCLAAHANCLTPLDVQLLQQTGTHVVHCPRTHRFFARPVAPLQPLWAAGVNVCLGTDSLASAAVKAELSLPAEMQTLAHNLPDLSAERIVEMVTINAARALNQSGKLGQLLPGATADVVAFPLPAGSVDPYEEVVFAEQPVTFSMIGGQVVIG